MGLFGKNKVNESLKLVPDKVVRIITADIRSKKPEELTNAVMKKGKDTNKHYGDDNPYRLELKDYLKKNWSAELKSDDEVDFILDELVGLGIIDELISDESITDIDWNGTFLITKSNSEDIRYSIEDLGFKTQKEADDYMHKIISKFANVMKLEFNPSNAILDSAEDLIRINAIHKSNSINGTSFSMRISRPRLTLNEDNFKEFAPEGLLPFIKMCSQLGSNTFVSGDMGTGKTTLLRLMLNYIPNDEKVFIMQDIPEMHSKVLFPDKHIVELVTTKSSPMTSLVNASYRSMVKYAIPAELRYPEETHRIFEAMKGNISCYSSLHTTSAGEIPERMLGMILDAKPGLNEERNLKLLLKLLGFGIHIEKYKKDGKTKRYLEEIVEFSPNFENGYRTLFKQTKSFDTFTYEVNDLSDELKALLAKKGIVFKMPTIDELFEEEGVDDE